MRPKTTRDRPRKTQQFSSVMNEIATIRTARMSTAAEPIPGEFGNQAAARRLTATNTTIITMRQILLSVEPALKWMTSE